jgi:hypothetical protein
MRRDFEIDIPDEQANAFLDSINNTFNTIKVEYFEAKAIRAIDLRKDIDTVLVPYENANIPIVKALKEAGKSVIQYVNNGISPNKDIKTLEEALLDASKYAFGIAIMPSVAKTAEIIDDATPKQETPVVEEPAQKQHDVIKPVEPVTDKKEATITVYNPVKRQTDSDPDTNGYLRKPKFGDVAIGNRDEYETARAKYFATGEETYIVIPELSYIRTPYGNGKFRVSDTMAKRFSGLNRVDVLIPLSMPDLDQMVRKTPTGRYFYSKSK